MVTTKKSKPARRGRPRGPTYGYQVMSVRFPPKMIDKVRDVAESQGQTIQTWVFGWVQFGLERAASVARITGRK